jgi:hypothetical protein
VGFYGLFLDKVYAEQRSRAQRSDNDHERRKSEESSVASNLHDTVLKQHHPAPLKRPYNDSAYS